MWELLEDELVRVLGMIMLITAFLCLVLSVINDNYSQVDRIWPVMPIIYAWVVTLYPVIKFDESLNCRLLISTIIITFWGSRLCYNFYRKGGYNKGGEDYRWVYLREKMNPVLFQIFNLTFIAYYQNFLILGFSFPGYFMYLNRNNEMNIYDGVLLLLLVLLLTGELIADQQMFKFQTEKYRLIGNKEQLTGDYKRGFITSGLFKYSRHPNFFCEIMIWWTYYSLSVSSSINKVCCSNNISIIGAILLTLLFQGSTAFTEKITKEKYPAYEIYQKRVSRLIPWFSSGDMDLVDEANKQD